METRHFNLLALAAVISLIAAGVVHSAYNSLDQEVVTGQKVFPALEGRSGDVHQVVLEQGEKTITLKKNDDGKGWGIVERGGYPVDAKKVREIVVKLSQAELIEPKTREDRLDLLRRRMEFLSDRIVEANALLEDETFTANAPAELIADHRRQIEEMQAEHDAIERVLRKLS